MSQFKKVKNSLTGETELQCIAKIIKISDGVLKLNNEKQTEYRTGQCEFVNIHGEIKRFPCTVWEKNVAKMTIGQEYLTTIRQVESTTNPGQMLYFFNVSALSSQLPSSDDFGDLFGEEAVVPTDSVLEQVEA